MKQFFTLVCLLLLFFSVRSQSRETHNFTTYDTTFNGQYGSWMIRMTRPAGMFTAGSPDAAARPAIITMPGVGEMGNTDESHLWTYGPHFWLNNGWDGSVVLGNGIHYPILVTVSFINNIWPSPEAGAEILTYLLNHYRIKRNSVHLGGLSQGAFVWTSLIAFEQTAGAETGMSMVTSLTALEGFSLGQDAPWSSWSRGDQAYAVWATKYHGKFFGLEGTADYRNVGQAAIDMNPVAPGSAYFSYENIGGGAHCCWNSMYDPNATNWTSTGKMGPNNATGAVPNSMGNYFAGESIFQWMIRQGDTSMVGNTTSSPPTVSAGTNLSITLPANSVTLSGSGLEIGGIISLFTWSQVSGPSQASFNNTGITGPVVSNLVAGTYVFKLTILDILGISASAQVSVTVNPKPVPAVSAGGDQAITLPANTVTLSGSASESNGSITRYAWSEVSGPSQYSINNAGVASPVISNLVAGTYVFQLTATDANGTTASDQVTVTVNQAVVTTPPPNNVPGGGSGDSNPTSGAAAIPGVVQAENYTNQIGIGTQPTTDDGGGLNVGWIDQGDFMSYNVNVANAGTYKVDFRVATPNSNASFVLNNAAGVTLATIKLNNTNGFETWATVSATVTLPAGPQTLYIVSTSSDEWNINWMQFTQQTTTAPTGALPIPGVIQAENLSNNFGVAAEQTSDAGGGQDIGWIDSGDWMDWTVNVQSAGTYTLSFRVATAGNGASFAVQNGANNVYTFVNVPNTGGYQSWTTVTANVTLPAGTQTLRITSTSTGGTVWNLNWIQASAAVSPNVLSIPGIIQAENLSNDFGVAAEQTLDAGGGQDIGWIDGGDWMDWTVNVQAAGTYTLSFRVATAGNGGSFAVQDGANNVYTYVSVPNTGGYQSWTTVTANVTLPAGTQTLRITSTSVGGTVWNLNWIQASVVAPPGAKLIPGTILASLLDNYYGIGSELTSDAGGGYDIGWIDPGDWMDYTVFVTTPGTYNVAIRLATPNNGAQFAMQNGAGGIYTFVNVPNTGGYQNWSTVNVAVTFPTAGLQTLRMTSTSAPGVVYNINWLQFSLTGIGNADVTPGSASSQAGALLTDSAAMGDGTSFVKAYPNPVKAQLTLDIRNSHLGKMRIQVINTAGVVMKNQEFNKDLTETQITVPTADLPVGIYFLRISGTDWSTTQKIVKY